MVSTKKSNIELEKEIELLKSQLESVQKKERTKKNSKRFKQKNPNDLIRENRKKYYEENIDKWINQSKKRLIKFLKHGFDPKNSEYLSSYIFRSFSPDCRRGYRKMAIKKNV